MVKIGEILQFGNLIHHTNHAPLDRTTANSIDYRKVTGRSNVLVLVVVVLVTFSSNVLVKELVSTSN